MVNENKLNVYEFSRNVSIIGMYKHNMDMFLKSIMKIFGSRIGRESTPLQTSTYF